MDGASDVDFTVPPDHPALAGHFPGHPVVPGVVILDHVLRALEQTFPGRVVTGAPSIKFLAPLLPGEIATIRLGGVAGGTLRFTVARAETTLAAGQFSVQLS